MDKEILSYLSPPVKRAIEKVPFSNLKEIEEIRLRAYKPLCFTIKGRNFKLNNSGNFTETDTECFIVSKEDVLNTFKNITSSSVFAHSEELSQGYITVANGVRVGICGRLTEDGNIIDITSLNLRIPREIMNLSDEIFKNYRNKGLLIAGPPGSGKTTLLRDFIRKTSEKKRVCVIDSRLEISGGIYDKKGFDLGNNSDVFISADKAKAIEILLRTLYPQVIAFDEIGSEEELNEIEQSFFSGVEIITTAHIGNLEELFKRKITAKLIKSKVLSDIVLLDKDKKLSFYECEELEKFV